MLQYKTVIWMW